jgi:hypothetical protein
MRRQPDLSSSPDAADGTVILDQGDNVSEFRAFVAALALILAPATAASAGPKAAIFPFELIDVSIDGALGGVRADEAQRLVLVTRELRQLAARDAGYDLVDLSGLTAETEKAAPLHQCGGCEVDIARRAGADIAVTGTVRKVSNLILGFTIQVRDVTSRRLTRVLQADIRGNTDESWVRGIRWLVANRLLTPQTP